MNGRIEVESIKGQGSTFRFFVKANTPSTFQHSSKPAPSDTASTRIFALHVLVVEGMCCRPDALSIDLLIVYSSNRYNRQPNQSKSQFAPFANTAGLFSDSLC